MIADNVTKAVLLTLVGLRQSEKHLVDKTVPLLDSTD